MISELRIVDKAILGSETDMFAPLYEIKPDIIALGQNQHFDEKELETKLKQHGINAKVVRIKDFKKCELCSSASIIQNIIEREKNEPKNK